MWQLHVYHGIDLLQGNALEYARFSTAQRQWVSDSMVSGRPRYAQP